MTKKLSEAFFGDKKLTEKIYQPIRQKGRFDAQDIQIIFQPYTSKISNILSKDGKSTLFDIFEEFIQAVIEQFKHWEFQKFTSVVEIAAHVFEYSFEHWLTKEQSYKYFSDVLVRHSLFRPPHSVCVFKYEDLTVITQYWLNHFHRYYEEYQECMASNLNEIIRCHILPGEQTSQKDLKEGRTVDKSEALKFLQ